MRVVYILGSGHCGSTLLDLLLSSHSKITGVGELWQIRDDKEVICTCTKPVTDCPFWKQTLKGLTIDNLKVYRKPLAFLANSNTYYNLRTSKPVNNKTYLTLNETIYKQALKAGNASLIIDSSKSPDRVELISKSDKIQPFIIHLVRDGRANTWSYYRKRKKFFRSAMRWVSANIKTSILTSRSNIPSIYVKYEDLVNNPKNTLTRILSALDLDYEEDMLHYQNFDHHQAGGNRMKFIKTSAIKEDTKWKHDMPLYQRILFNTLFGWLNLYYTLKK